MIKKSALLLIIILFISVCFVYSESSFQKGELDEGESKIFNMSDGFYILTLVTVSDQTDAAIFRLNNEMSGKLREKESYRFDDESEIVVRSVVSNEAGEGDDFAGYYLYLSGDEPMKVKLYSEDPDVCDFNKKCENETQEECCYDCKCSGGYDCVSNACKDECKKDSECDDFDACTTDDCVDGGCRYAEEKGCELGNKCVEKGHVDNERYCDDNEWVVQRKGDEECSNDYECINGKCDENKCVNKEGSKGIIIFLLILLLLIIVAYTRRDFIIRKLKRRVI